MDEKQLKNMIRDGLISISAYVMVSFYIVFLGIYLNFIPLILMGVILAILGIISFYKIWVMKVICGD